MHGRQEIHFNDLDAGTFTFLAAAAGHVEGEHAGLVAAHLGVLRLLKELPDVVENGGEGSRIGTRGTADGALVNTAADAPWNGRTSA